MALARALVLPLVFAFWLPLWFNESEGLARVRRPRISCAGFRFQELQDGRPFATGEELSYDLSVAGIYIGRFETKVGRPRVVDGARVLSLFGRGRTITFTSSFQQFSGRYMALVDPRSFEPIGVRVEATVDGERRWEHVRFERGQRKVTTEFLYRGKEGTRTFEITERLLDGLGMLYFARTRSLPVGAEGCQEIFGSRRLWRVDARIDGTRRVDTPVGEKEALVVNARFTRLPHPEYDRGILPAKPVDVELLLGTDANRTPLGFVFKSEQLTAEGKLVRWSAHGESDQDWTF